jgi:hypothetical protein
MVQAVSNICIVVVAQVSAQLASLQAHQALMAQQLAAAHAANDTLRTELVAVQVGVQHCKPVQKCVSTVRL